MSIPTRTDETLQGMYVHTNNVHIVFTCMSRNNQSLNSIFLSEAKNAASQKMFMITIIRQCDVNNDNINNAVKSW